MKRACLFFLFVFTLSVSKADVSYLFTIDETEIATEMEDLNMLEAFLSIHPDFPLNEKQVICPMLASHVILTRESSFLNILNYNDRRINGDDDCMLYSVCLCCATSILTMIYYLVISPK